MLIPVYIFGFVFAGLVLFAIAQRIPNRLARIWLRTIAVAAGPIFFLVVVIFSGWEREKTYEMEWLTGIRAAEYLSYGRPVVGDHPDIVLLKRDIGNNHECYDGFNSPELAHYLESLPNHSVKVRYKIIYDFYQPRGSNIESIGDYGHETADRVRIPSVWIAGGEKLRINSKVKEKCFAW